MPEWRAHRSLAEAPAPHRGLEIKKLQQWWNLPEHMYLQLEDGTRIKATFDERQRGSGRLSSVQYLRFDTGGQVPIAAGVGLIDLQAETLLADGQKQALRTDVGP